MSESHRTDVLERHGQACRERRLVLASRVDQPARASGALGEDEVRQLLRATRRTGSTRGRALLALLSGTGLRLAEAAALDVDDVPTPERTGAEHVRAGKRERPRTVPLPADARSLLRCWLTERARHPAALRASPPCGWAAGTACPPGSCSASSPNWAPTPGWWTSARTPCGTPRRPAGCAPAFDVVVVVVYSVTLPRRHSDVHLAHRPGACPPTGSWPTDRELAGAVEAGAVEY